MSNIVEHTRFKDAPDYKYICSKTNDLKDNNRLPVVVGGVGGIGSWVILCLARMGLYIVAYDFDTVEASNVGGQLYGHNQLGMKKTEALYANIKPLCSSFGFIGMSKFDEQGLTAPVMFSCFDKMEPRKVMYEKFLACTDPNKIFIDGRLTAEVYEVYAVTAANQEEYNQYLFDDSETGELSCTFAQTTYLALGVASAMVNVMTNHFTNLFLTHKVFDVPLKQYYHAPTASLRNG